MEKEACLGPSRLVRWESQASGQIFEAEVCSLSSAAICIVGSAAFCRRSPDALVAAAVVDEVNYVVDAVNYLL